MNHSISLETQRLTLRMFTSEDLDELFHQLSDPDVMRYYPAALSRKECEKWLEGTLRNYESNGFGMTRESSIEHNGKEHHVYVLTREQFVTT